MSSLRPRSRVSRLATSPNRAESQVQPSAPEDQDEGWPRYTYFETKLNQNYAKNQQQELDEFGFPVSQPNQYEMQPTSPSNRFSIHDSPSLEDDEKYARDIHNHELQNELSRPQSAYLQPQKASDYPQVIPRNKPTRRERIDTIVNDPRVARQLMKRKRHRPYFIWIVSIVQFVMFVVSLIENNRYTNQVIEAVNLNPMIGPSAFTLIRLGARFVPCMKPQTTLTGKTLTCPASAGVSGVCTVNDICGLPPDAVPNQWWRFISPIFLHGGIVHILMNMLFQIQTGSQLEADFGWRIIPIYMISGIFGFIFGANFSPQTMPSVGASGSLFGLLGCILIDLLQNWKIVLRPWRSLFGIVGIMIISFIIGLFPGIDNFSHIGGFISGSFAAVVFLPTIHFGKWDKRMKVIGRVIAFGIIVLIYVGLLLLFYKGNANETCTWCKYLSCLPVGNFCDAFNQ